MIQAFGNEDFVSTKQTNKRNEINVPLTLRSSMIYVRISCCLYTIWNWTTCGIKITLL